MNAKESEEEMDRRADAFVTERVNWRGGHMPIFSDASDTNTDTLWYVCALSGEAGGWDKISIPDGRLFSARQCEEELRRRGEYI